MRGALRLIGGPYEIEDSTYAKRETDVCFGRGAQCTAGRDKSGCMEGHRQASGGGL